MELSKFFTNMTVFSPHISVLNIEISILILQMEKLRHEEE